MVNWKRTRLEFTPETYDHIKKHGVRWFEIEEVFNHEFIPHKVRVENETDMLRLVSLLEGFRWLSLCLCSGNRIRVITAYEPSDRRKRVYGEKRKRYRSCDITA